MLKKCRFTNLSGAGQQQYGKLAVSFFKESLKGAGKVNHKCLFVVYFSNIMQPKTCINCFQKEIFKLYYQRFIETLKAFHMHQFEWDKS